MHSLSTPTPAAAQASSRPYLLLSRPCKDLDLPYAHAYTYTYTAHFDSRLRGNVLGGGEVLGNTLGGGVTAACVLDEAMKTEIDGELVAS